MNLWNGEEWTYKGGCMIAVMARSKGEKNQNIPLPRCKWRKKKEDLKKPMICGKSLEKDWQSR